MFVFTCCYMRFDESAFIWGLQYSQADEKKILKMLQINKK